jgi:hypothetical protein
MFVAMSTRQLLSRTSELASRYLDDVGARRVGSLADYGTLLDAMGGALPDAPRDPLDVIERLVASADPGLVATAGPRHFGFVIGGALPAALAADWLSAAWDQNAFSFVLSPAAAVVEEVARRWLTELLGLAPDTSMGVVTGATMANFTSLAAARHALLLRLGWNVEEQGLFGAPPIAVVTNEESHVSVFASLQMLGLGRARVSRVAADEQGRMRPTRSKATLRELRNAGHRLRSGRQREHRRVRSVVRHRADGARRGRMVARRRGVRCVGGGRSVVEAPHEPDSSSPTPLRWTGTSG